MKMEIDTTALTIPLRYHRVWTIEFTTATEKFNSPLLSLFGFVYVVELEKAIDCKLSKRLE